VLVDSIDLPEVAELEHYRPATTTELYDIHGERIGSFALQRRVAIGYNDFSPILRQAVISIEDKGFEHHFGINIFRVIGAALHDVTAHRRAQGASTLTMQLARNLFLSDERTAGRKLQETLLSIQIERSFTKPQIFTMYGNQIYLGHGVYGFEAGAEFYFSRHASELTLAQAATLAGLPKGPEEFSPTQHPDRCLLRRNLVIASLRSDGKINRDEAAAAKAAPLGLQIEPPPNSLAPWFVEAVRRELDKQLGAETVHAAGLRVYTTLDLGLQRTANAAVLQGLADYERRSGWHGHLVNLVAENTARSASPAATRRSTHGGVQTAALAEANASQVVLNVATDAAADSPIDYRNFQHPDWRQPPAPGAWRHAIVQSVSPARVQAAIGAPGAAGAPGVPTPSAEAEPASANSSSTPGGSSLSPYGAPLILSAADWAWTGFQSATQFLRPGDVIYVHLTTGGPQGWHGSLEQDSGAQGALMAMDNDTGDVLALVGGRDFALSQYDRATEARRQVGSSFKPYVYTAAIEKGVTPDQLILDAPTSFGGYQPRDFEGNTLGEITIEKAFADSRNIPAVRLAANVGMPGVIATAHRFGITGAIPPYLPVALGAVEIPLAEQVAAYAVFPNDGMRVQPRLIRRITDSDGIPIVLPHAVGSSIVISPGVAHTMVRLMRAVTAPGGTGADAVSLNHPVAGKTGTTSGFTDAWFVGYSPSMTCGVWVGYDNRTPLGQGETGGRTALPIWMDVLRVADAQHPGERFSGD
jgi:penicillin-binding protein 1A